jgi:hypothetical protein
MQRHAWQTYDRSEPKAVNKRQNSSNIVFLKMFAPTGVTTGTHTARFRIAGRRPHQTGQHFTHESTHYNRLTILSCSLDVSSPIKSTAFEYLPRRKPISTALTCLPTRRTDVIG